MVRMHLDIAGINVAIGGRMTAPIRSMPELIAALRDCVHERGVAYGTVDAIAGLPDRYTSKLLAPEPIKNLGPISFEGILGAVGKAVILVDDPEQIKRVEGRWTPRKRPLKRDAEAARLSMPQTIQETPDLQAQQERTERMKMLGKLGGKASAKRRMKTMGKRARQRIASHAARIRWAKNSSPPISV